VAAPEKLCYTGAMTDTQERIAKVMARAGLCSRREAETWIAAGRVAVNGQTLASPAVTVGADDVVVVDGKPLPTRDRTRLWLFHKPRGLVTTTRDPEGRPTVFEHLPRELPRVVTVGRLDINTEGLLLLTNDGGLARVLELPATGWLRRYRVRAHGTVTQEQLTALADGIAIDGILYGAVEATLDRVQGRNCWMTIGLREGKNREVKNILLHLGLDVTRLIRLSFGPFQLGELAEGAIEEVNGRTLRDQLGERLEAESKADFTRPAALLAPKRDETPHPMRRERMPDAQAMKRRHDADVDHGADAARRGGKPGRPPAKRVKGAAPKAGVPASWSQRPGTAKPQAAPSDRPRAGKPSFSSGERPAGRDGDKRGPGGRPPGGSRPDGGKPGGRPSGGSGGGSGGRPAGGGARGNADRRR
jgi:23S rRNA pseudouridine2605 synthase